MFARSVPSAAVSVTTNRFSHTIVTTFVADKRVTGQNGIGQNGTEKWYGQNGTDKMLATFIDSNSTELNFYLVITSHK